MADLPIIGQDGAVRSIQSTSLIKKYSPEAHWPITKYDLDPYLDRAKDILDVSGKFSDQRLNQTLKRINFLFSRPTTRFGEKYGETLRTSSLVVLAPECNLVGVQTDGRRVSHFRVRDFQERHLDVRAGNFVLACGGIENSRLLLHFNEETEGRLIAEPRMLGRYWMEHPHFTIGEAIITMEEFNESEFFSLTPERMLALEVLNCGLRLQPLRQHAGLRRLAHDLACTAPSLGGWVYQQTGRRLVCATSLRAAWEQEPNYDSHISLSGKQRDIFGIPRPILHWQKTARDIATVRETAIELGAHLARTKRGRIKLDPWVLEDGPFPQNDEFGGNHHMGGTRMSSSPANGIVTSNLRLWNQDNMYVAGSSVFPSCGHANPTLTIVQLSLRLADHLS